MNFFDIIGEDAVQETVSNTQLAALNETMTQETALTSLPSQITHEEAMEIVEEFNSGGENQRPFHDFIIPSRQFLVEYRKNNTFVNGEDTVQLKPTCHWRVCQKNLMLKHILSSLPKNHNNFLLLGVTQMGDSGISAQGDSREESKKVSIIHKPFAEEEFNHFSKEPDTDEEEAADDAFELLSFHAKYPDVWTDDELRTNAFMSKNLSDNFTVGEWAELWERKFSDMGILAYFKHGSCYQCGCMESQVRICIDTSVDPYGQDRVSDIYCCLNPTSLNGLNEKLIPVVRRARLFFG